MIDSRLTLIPLPVTYRLDWLRYFIKMSSNLIYATSFYFCFLIYFITSNFLFVIIGIVSYFVDNVLHKTANRLDFEPERWFLVRVQIIAASGGWRCINTHWDRSSIAHAIFEWRKWIATCRDEIVFVTRSNGLSIIFVGATVGTNDCPAARLKGIPSGNVMQN